MQYLVLALQYRYFIQYVGRNPDHQFRELILDDTRISQKTQCTEASSVSVPSPYLGALVRAAEQLYYSHSFYCLGPSGVSDTFPHHTILGFAPFLAFLIFNLAIFACFWPLVGPEGRGQIFILCKNAFASASIITEDHKV